MIKNEFSGVQKFSGRLVFLVVVVYTFVVLAWTFFGGIIVLICGRLKIGVFLSIANEAN